jgi:cell division protein FtsI/penicillin-binding protein 2
MTLGFLLAVAWLGMLGRVAFVQVAQSDYYRGLAYTQSIRRNVVTPKRGEILDKDLQKLVVNADVELDEAKGAAGHAKVPARKLSRVAPMGPLAGQVLGNVNRDGYGQLGLEYFLDRELRGTDGWKYIRHDVKNHYYPGFQENQKAAIDGLNVVLTLDSKLQSVVEHALERGVQKAGARQGVALVVDPFTGDILSMANYPFYNPNTRDLQDAEAWKNQAVCKVYEPGSTFKAITASALMEEELIKPSDTLDGENGSYKIMGEVIRDTHPRGRISFKDAMAFSSNICFAKASTRLKPETFYRYIRSFGFGMKSGVGLPAEESGVLKAVGDWSGRTQATIAFGHEVSATPLQVAMAFSAVANGGMLMKPRIVKAWVDADGNAVQESSPKAVRRVISEATAEKVKSLLAAVVEYGTASDIRTDRIPLAGKTGTAEKIDATGHYVKGCFNSSFVGMAPVDKPEIVCLILLDEPSQFKYGGQSAAPIFREIVDRMLADPDFSLARRTMPVASASMALEAPHGAGDSSVVPNLMGYGRGDALRALAGTGRGAKMEGEGDVVLSQHPRPGSKASVKDTLVLSLGFVDSRTMPDLSNKLRDALLKLKSLGLEVEYSGAGRIIRQEPAMGKPVRSGQKCVLTLGWMG